MEVTALIATVFDSRDQKTFCKPRPVRKFVLIRETLGFAALASQNSGLIILRR
jgi:hypothetical protein